MLSAHPEIASLYGPCWRTKYVCIGLVFSQLGLAWLLRDAPWWLMLLVGYAVGGVMTHSLLLAIHELSHNLAFKKPLHNRLFALFANLPVGLPVAATFKHYHLLHHTRQGEDGVDTDLPTRLEARWLRSWWTKLIWTALQGFAYGLRPLLVAPKRPDRWELTNLAVQLIFNSVLIYFWGWQAFLYLPISALMVMGLHPVAGHYISEHYVFSGDQETYSYYGPLNRISFNVGYHNEHHDFPYIPGSRLPELRRMAPEFYEPLAHHTSWAKTLWQYITTPGMGAHRRVRRKGRSSTT